MEAKELKVGNLLILDNIKHRPHESGKIHKVVDIREKSATIIIPQSINEYGQYYEFLKPLKIDIGILLQLGFVYDVLSNKYIFTDKETRCKLKIGRNTAGCWFCHLGKRYYFSYIHEIQNLYSSLYPGRELKK